LQLHADGGYQVRIRRLEGTPNYGPRQFLRRKIFVELSVEYLGSISGKNQRGSLGKYL
jgi:hypothetical protein